MCKKSEVKTVAIQTRPFAVMYNGFNCNASYVSSRVFANLLIQKAHKKSPFAGPS